MLAVIIFNGLTAKRWSTVLLMATFTISAQGLWSSKSTVHLCCVLENVLASSLGWNWLLQLLSHFSFSVPSSSPPLTVPRRFLKHHLALWAQCHIVPSQSSSEHVFLFLLRWSHSDKLYAVIFHPESPLCFLIIGNRGRFYPFKWWLVGWRSKRGPVLLAAMKGRWNWHRAQILSDRHTD